MIYDRVLRELKWLTGAIAIAAAIVAVESLQTQRSQPPSEYAGAATAFYGLTIVVRLIIWFAKGHARAFQFWRETIVVIGAAVLAYGLGARYEDTDRVLIAAGAALIAGSLATVVRR